MNSVSDFASNRFDASFPSVKIAIIISALSVFMNWLAPIAGEPDRIAYHLALLCVASGGLWYFVWSEIYGKIQGKTASFGVHVFSTAFVPLLTLLYSNRIFVG